MISPDKPHSDKPRVPSDALMGGGEDMRGPEFKAARKRLVDGVNDHLETMRQKRGTREQPGDGTLLSDQPRLQVTEFGPSGPHTHLTIEEPRTGASLTGDGISTPLELQVVRAGETPDSLDITWVRGSDPVARQVYGDDTYSPDRQAEIVAAFGKRYISADGQQGGSFEFYVMGDGRIVQRSVGVGGTDVNQSLDGGHPSQPQLDFAQEVLSYITAAIQ